MQNISILDATTLSVWDWKGEKISNAVFHVRNCKSISLYGLNLVNFSLLRHYLVSQHLFERGCAVEKDS